MEFEIQVIADSSFPGLGSQLKRITYGGETYAHLGLKDNKWIVHINKTMPIGHLIPLTRYIEIELNRLENVRQTLLGR